jgi:hypothetical protein
MRPPKNTFSARLPLAVTLIIASFVSAIFISSMANKGEDYWVVRGAIITGHVISSSDLEVAQLNLSNSSDLYIDKSLNPIGLIALRTMQQGEVIGAADLGASIAGQSTSAVPLSVRSVDIAKGLALGEGVESTGNSFSGDVGLSVAVENTQVLRVLSATTVGRLVIIASHV